MLLFSQGYLCLIPNWDDGKFDYMYLVDFDRLNLDFRSILDDYVLLVLALH
jgi:hypothetical protein